MECPLPQPNLPDRHRARQEALERELLEVAGSIRVLGTLSWPPEVVARFLESVAAGAPELPVYETPRVDLASHVAALERVMARADRGHALGELLWRTAWSYATAARMLTAVGTPSFTDYSVELYGRPDQRRGRRTLRDLDAADLLLELTSELLGSYHVPDTEPTLSASEVADALRVRIRSFFREDPMAVELVPTLTSKASAGSRRLSLRPDARFTDLDVEQLAQHEAFVHAATLLNGKKQEATALLGVGAPRTTRTQEGLATLAELATGAMDLERLRRIALRARAVALALAGADFVEVYRMFEGEGQSPEESAQATARIFRGGDPRGGIAFTKDAAYVGGLLEVHRFLRLAVRENRPELIPALFLGRLSLGDVLALQPLVEEGILRPAVYVPPWARDLRRLTATLTYSVLVNRLQPDAPSLDLLPELEEPT